MSKRTLARTVALALGVSLALGAVIPALAAQAPQRVTIKTIGKVSIKANRFLRDSVRFNRDSYSIRRNGRLTISDRSRQPHTLSLVRRGQVPGNFRQMERCYSPNGPCSSLGVDHGAINPETGEEQDPTVPLVNKGAEGFNQPGDSVYIPPRKKARVQVTAARGKRLNYICAIHPWMQGRLNVR